MKSQLLVIILSLLTFNTIAHDRVKIYNINSLEGLSQTLTVTDGGPASDELRIGYKKTKITVTNYWLLREIATIKNKFLKITYAVRGGSCVGVEYVILLCVSHDKLMVPLHIHTMQSGCGADEDDMYTLKFDITGSTVNQFKMNIHIHDKKDIRNPKLGKSYDKRRTAYLNFDSKNAIFYNGSKTINGNFITGFTESEKPINASIKGTFPMIRVKGSLGGDDNYYYINGYWHQEEQENYLMRNYK